MIASDKFVEINYYNGTSYKILTPYFGLKNLFYTSYVGTNNVETITVSGWSASNYLFIIAGYGQVAIAQRNSDARVSMYYRNNQYYNGNLYKGMAYTQFTMYTGRVEIKFGDFIDSVGTLDDYYKNKIKAEIQFNYEGTQYSCLVISN